jgi:hypothetical protein
VGRNGKEVAGQGGGHEPEGCEGGLGSERGRAGLGGAGRGGRRGGPGGAEEERERRKVTWPAPRPGPRAGGGRSAAGLGGLKPETSRLGTRPGGRKRRRRRGGGGPTGP